MAVVGPKCACIDCVYVFPSFEGEGVFFFIIVRRKGAGERGYYTELRLDRRKRFDSRTSCLVCETMRNGFG